MQLAAETDIDRAIAELQQALPIVALQNIVERRIALHQPRAEVSRTLMLMRARQLIDEARQ